MRRIKVLFLILFLGLSVFIACKKNHPTLIGCECPAIPIIWNKWQWIGTQNGSGQINYPQAGSNVLLSFTKYGQYIASVNGQGADSGKYATTGFDTLHINPFLKSAGGLNLPDSLYYIKYAIDSIHFISLPNSPSGNTDAVFLLVHN